MTDSLLPPNATPLETALAQVMAERIGALAAPLRALWSPTDCPEVFLPWLAATVGVEQWSDAWPIAIRRARVASAIAIHRYKGTVRAVTDIASAYGGNLRLTEWWQTTPPGAPFTFALSLSVGGQVAAPTADFITALIADISRAKPARAHFTVTTATNASAAIAICAVARAGTYQRLSLVAA